jgi:UDP-3-O-[3-hydroxymyristoyl] N-acetylglucosamine deacetylase
MRYQQTLGRVTGCEGIGLHTGEFSKVRFLPALVDTGIVFIRHVNGRKIHLRAEAGHVVSTSFSTTLGMNGVTVGTVEHLMAACAGLKIDNLYIEVEGPEIPILDGSAWPFIKVLKRAGIVRQRKLQPYLKIEKSIVISEGQRFIQIDPSDHFNIRYSMRFDQPFLPDQSYCYEGDEARFIREISKARTYGFLKDVDRLRAAGLIRGGSLQNAVVIGDGGVMNEDGFRYPDELVRHKVLDLIGDLALLGRPLVGTLTVHSAGHALHTELVTAILRNKLAWSLIGDLEQPVPAFVPSRLAVAPRFL